MISDRGRWLFTRSVGVPAPLFPRSLDPSLPQSLVPCARSLTVHADAHTLGRDALETTVFLRPDQLDVDRACVLVIDVQQKLLPLITDAAQIVAAARLLLEGARIFKVPVIATEQYVKGLGHTVEPLWELLQSGGATVLEKLAFSACGEPSVRDALLAIDRPQVVLAGIEAHVCVQQTALDLHRQDYGVFVCADATGSRRTLDAHVALERLRHAGVVVTTAESVLFELCNRCDTPDFKRMIELIKGSSAAVPADRSP